MNLKLSNELSLPIDAATQTFAFIGRKGSGKTFGAGKLTELLMDASVQCVILDTVGNWYGLRLAADGKGPGFDIPVLGGLRGDIPLEANGGALVADLVADTGRSVIVDLSQFSLGDRKRFATEFGLKLWQRKKAERTPSPLHLVIEECQLIIPQFVGRDDARMVGIFDEIVRLGRNYGIGVSMITQRPQSVNKEALTQTECLVVFQVNGSPERKALKDWIVHQGMDVGLVDQLPSLDVGTAFVWSPQWLRILQKVRVAAKRTFDASATPKVGTKQQRADLAPLDLAAFRDKMSAAIEHAKANDPAELKRTIAGLKKQVADLEKRQPEAKPVQVPTFTKEEASKLKSIEDALFSNRGQIEGLKLHCEEMACALAAIRNRLTHTKAPAPIRPVIQGGQEKFYKAPPLKPSPVITNGAGASISGGPRRMMVALAQRPGLTKKQIAVRAGLSSRSGTFGTYLGRLRSEGWVYGSDSLQLTEAGVEAVGNYAPLPEREELLEYWLRELGESGAGRMLRTLADHYPEALTKAELGEVAEISSTSGTFGTYLGRLRSLELVEGKAELRASSEFFE
jgi:uncharacterized protein